MGLVGWGERRVLSLSLDVVVGWTDGLLALGDRCPGAGSVSASIVVVVAHVEAVTGAVGEASDAVRGAGCAGCCTRRVR